MIYKKNLTIVFSSQQHDLLIGTLLGDGYLQTFTDGKTWRYQIKQSARQKDYVFHKYEILHNLCSTDPKFNSLKNRRIKFVPEDIANFLNLRTIAYWYMDDGSLHQGSNMVFCTNCFTRYDQSFLISAFENLYNLKPFMLESFYYKLPN